MKGITGFLQKMPFAKLPKKQYNKLTASSIAISEPEQGTFDIEYVRKQIIIKGQAFEIPMALKDLPEGWTYEEKETSLLDGLGMATFYYEENEMFVGSMENFYDDKKTNGIIYSVFFDTNDCSIALFFVDGKYHRQGIGKKLFQKITECSDAKKMTVNSSSYAVPIYRKLGFVDTGKEQTVSGLRFTPMIYDVI